MLGWDEKALRVGEQYRYDDVRAHGKEVPPEQTIYSAPSLRDR
jgi:hypothetical protein